MVYVYKRSKALTLILFSPIDIRLAALIQQLLQMTLIGLIMELFLVVTLVTVQMCWANVQRHHLLTFS